MTVDAVLVAPAAQPPATPAWMTDVRNAVLLGDLHQKQGKTQDAIEAYQKALSVDPNLEGVQKALDELQAKAAGKQI